VGQRLIQRRGELAEAVDPLPVAQRLRQGGAKGETQVLVGVVVVYVHVTHSLDGDVKQPVARNLLAGQSGRSQKASVHLPLSARCV
jgi:hypothetical protein